MIKLFMQILRGEWFHYGDKPNKKLLKTDDSHYVGPMGQRRAHPHVAVFPDNMDTTPRKPVFWKKKG